MEDANQSTPGTIRSSSCGQSQSSMRYGEWKALSLYAVADPKVKWRKTSSIKGEWTRNLDRQIRIMFFYRLCLRFCFYLYMRVALFWTTAVFALDWKMAKSLNWVKGVSLSLTMRKRRRAGMVLANSISSVNSYQSPLSQFDSVDAVGWFRPHLFHSLAYAFQYESHSIEDVQDSSRSPAVPCNVA